MDLIYLQCDCRFNRWMMEEINGRNVIDYTIERCKKIGGGKCEIISGIYDCIENQELIEVLLKNGVNVIKADEENVNKRFLDIVCQKNIGEYVVRVSGDQCLLDFDKVTDVIENMRKNLKDWYYEDYSSSVLPDVVSVDCLKKYEMILRKGNRYFDILKNQKDVKRYILSYPILILSNFRANSNENFRICKNVIENNLNIYDISKQLLIQLINSPYLVQTGVWGSWIIPSKYNDFFYDENKDVNPWWGRSIIDLIKKHLNKSMRVFEWGSGNSTLFWGKYVKEVVSIEHDRNWYEKMLNIVPENVKLNYYELEYGGEYCKSILKEKDYFDIILIDGRDRVECMKNAVKHLTKDGILILDNSEREYYELGDDFLKRNGFKKLEISSIIYGLPGVEDFTAIYYRENNILNL